MDNSILEKQTATCFVVNGETSSDADVELGIPQGTVLGPLLFLCHINDFPDRVKSTVRMFANECLIYRDVKSRADHIQLQHNLLASQEWADSWGISFKEVLYPADLQTTSTQAVQIPAHGAGIEPGR